MAAKSLANAVSAYGASLKPKLSNIAITGAPEDQLRGPLETLIKDLAEVGGLAVGTIQLVGETTLSDIKTRPDFAVIVSKALVGFIEVKAPGKGADPRRFDNEHDKELMGQAEIVAELDLHRWKRLQPVARWQT